ncbi:MAG: putative baseplate assembly protein [Blastocatellales bacterium]
MPLPAPELDNRTAQSIVDEAKRMIPQLCPEWTDHNVSDPGVTLIELFAWMTEMLLYRVNQVPAKNYIKFLDLLGLKLRPPRAAKVNLTFYLSTRLNQLRDPINVHAGTEIATVRTETKPAIIFTTIEDLDLRSPELIGALTQSQRENRTDIINHDLARLGVAGSTITMFSNPPEHKTGNREGDAFYLVFGNDIGRHVISLGLQFQRHKGYADGVTLGVTADDPPRQWQAWAGDELGWINCPIEKDGDGTRGFTQDGEISLRLPAMESTTLNNLTGFFLRCVLTSPKSSQSPYLISPALKEKITVATIGGTIRAENYSQVKNELLGVSDGTPGQKFRFSHQPLLARTSGERLLVEVKTQEEPEPDWNEVRDFGNSDKFSPHYTIDELEGSLSFGPVLLQSDGNMHAYGKIPPRGAQLSFTRYRYGGGTAGNVGAGTVTVAKENRPYITRVTNWEPASGGRDAESLEEAVLRIPAELRSHERAVTAEDFEYHAKSVSGVADAYCVGPGRLSTNGSSANKSGVTVPGQVVVYLLPQVGGTDNPRFDQITLDEHIRAAVLAELQKRSVLGISVEVKPVQVVGVSVATKLVCRDRDRNAELKKEATTALDRFLNPYSGGPQGKGWRQVSLLHISDINRLLLNLPLVERVESVFLHNDSDNQPIHDKLELGQIVVCSGKHKIEVS